MNNLQLLLSTSALVVVSTSLHAEDAQHQFNIPAQNLGPALQTLAAQSGVSIFYADNSVAGLNARAIKGQLSTRNALNQLLSGSNLIFNLAADGSISVKPAPAQLNKAEPATLKAVTVSSDALYNATDPYNKDYVLPNATAGTKTDTPIMETPLNVQVISKQVLKDQQAINLDQALKNVSGVVANSQTFANGLQSSYTIRGFQTWLNYRNGFRNVDDSYGTLGSVGTRQMANVESVEVLKGPAAILYGRIEPGGMVNVVTKQPLSTPYYSMQQQFGSYNLYRTVIDATGPITADNSLLYRVSGSYDDQGSYQDLTYTKTKFIAPQFKWNITDATSALFEFEFQQTQSSAQYTIQPIVDGKILRLLRSLNLLEPLVSTGDRYFGSLTLEHHFNEDWSAKWSTRVNSATGISPSVFTAGLDPATHTLTRTAAAYGNDKRNYSTELNITGHFDTGWMKHTLLMGGDYYRMENNIPIWFGNTSDIDYLNPIHAGVPPLTLNTSVAPPLTLSTYADNFGLYLQDQIKLPYGIQVMGGLRYQTVHQNITDNFSPPSPPLSADAVTPRVALLWQAKDWLSLYGNYVEGWNPQSGVQQNGKQVPPTGAEQWEVGVKTQFFGGRLQATLDYFNLIKTNIATSLPGTPYSIVTGAVRSRGPELDIRGEILPGWNAIVTYAWQDVRTTKSNNGDQGFRQQFVPEHMGSLWTTYEMQSGELQGLKVGTGLNLQTNITDYFNTVKGPGYVTWDLMAGYSFKLGKQKITTQLNVNNLLDKDVFIPGFGDGSYGQPTLAGVSNGQFVTPRTLMGSIQLEF